MAGFPIHFHIKVSEVTSMAETAIYTVSFSLWLGEEMEGIHENPETLKSHYFQYSQNFMNTNP
jgi:hypothetical protein